MSGRVPALCHERRHAMTEGNVSWQLDGKGRAYPRCRACNAERAYWWRLANEDRLVRAFSSNGKQLPPGRRVR